MIVELIGGPYDGARIELPDTATQIEIPYFDIHPTLLQQLLHRYQTGEDIEAEVHQHLTELTYQPTNNHDTTNRLWRLQ